MLRSTAIFLTKRFRVIGTQPHTFCFSTSPQTQGLKCDANNDSREETKDELDQRIGSKAPRKDKLSLLMRTLPDLGDSKDAIYGALDDWVAWEKDFPIGVLKNVLLSLKKENQWHKVIQVIKWILSKGQGNTMGTYHQLIHALQKDNRAEEAHNFWMKKIGNDLHSVPWPTCHLMISIYFENGMFDRLVKLFKCFETFDRKLHDKFTVQKVADAYENLGLIDDKTKLLEKYKDLVSRETKYCDKESTGMKSNRNKWRRKHLRSGTSSSYSKAHQSREN